MYRYSGWCFEMTKDPIPKDLFETIVCPKCKSKLVYNSDKTQLVCIDCGEKYPIKDGIPVLQIKELK